MLTQILNRWTNAVIFECECSLESHGLRLGFAVKAAIAASANLTDANLTDANLTRANLTGANLTDANLTRANLARANLTRANLTRANLARSNLARSNLARSNLRDSNLRDSNLSGSDLSGSNLRGSNLRGSDLSGSNLRGSNLRGSDLTPIRDDIWAVLSSSPAEVPSLRRAIMEGRINGSAYEGECACLVGTIANARQCDFNRIPGLLPDAGRPAERFFLAIGKGDTPEKSQFSKLAVEWIDQWLANVRTLVGSL